MLQIKSIWAPNYFIENANWILLVTAAEVMC